MQLLLFATKISHMDPYQFIINLQQSSKTSSPNLFSIFPTLLTLEPSLIKPLLKTRSHVILILHKMVSQKIIVLLKTKQNNDGVVHLKIHDVNKSHEVNSK